MACNMLTSYVLPIPHLAKRRLRHGTTTCSLSWATPLHAGHYLACVEPLALIIS